MAEHRVGYGFDVHRLVTGKKLIIGGIKVVYEKGLEGHSDADVLLHAICDALLGAASLGDIGQLFPPDDAQYEDADSGELLKEVHKKVQAAGWTEIENIDVTVMAERPHLGSYIIEIEKNVANILAIDLSRINIKATTTEKLGFVGREEGIAVSAVCLVKRND